MIEANGDNKNGGIFSYSTEPSLLTCPPKVFKPKLLKKFGDWNEETESLAKYAPTSLQVMVCLSKQEVL